MSNSTDTEEGKNANPEKETPLVTKATEGTALQDQGQEATSVSTSAKCAYCGNAIPGDQRFCVYCGAPTGINANSIVCPNPNCGDAMPLGTLFCGSCGMSLRPSSPVDIRGRLVVDVPNQTALPKKQNRAWLGAGIAVTVLFLVGLSFWVGARLGEEPKPRPVVLDTPSEKPLPPVLQPPSKPPEELPPTPSSKPANALPENGKTNQDPGRGISPDLIAKPEPPPSELPGNGKTNQDPGRGILPDRIAKTEPPPPPAPHPYLRPGSYKITAAQSVPVRSAPDETAEKLQEKAPGETVTVANNLGRWVEIRSKKGRAGYIPREALGDTPVPETEQKNTASTPEG